MHEGGYSELYVPFCGLAVIEQLAQTRSQVGPDRTRPHCMLRTQVVSSQHSMHVYVCWLHPSSTARSCAGCTFYNSSAVVLISYLSSSKGMHMSATCFQTQGSLVKTAHLLSLYCFMLATVQVSDPYWEDVSSYGYQSLQPHQDDVIKAAEQQVDKLRSAVKARALSNGAAKKAR